jgi:GR25 family glycosyltransferase involved in LPS biosynthesis
VLIWKEMIDNNIPYMTIFEDDILFHHLWDTLAPSYFKKTPTDYDILYIGSQIQGESKYHIDQVPVYCTHAYIITLEGAKKLYDLIINEPNGMYTIDGMLIDLMHAKRFKWYIWNGSFYPPEKKMAEGWNIRNNGLVYQDENFGTDIMNYI